MKRFQKNKRFIAILLMAGFLLSGCRQDKPLDEQKSRIPVVTFQMTPSSNGVEDFIKSLDNYSEENEGHYYNIVPEDIADNYGFGIFKSDLTCSSLLVYDNERYPLGECFGGYGTTSFAVADLNEDGEWELYFTYSWGSGIHRSEAGYFDSASKEVMIFDYENFFAELLLETDDNHELGIYDVDWDADCNIKSFVDIEMSAGDKIASAAVHNGKIVLVFDSRKEK